MSDAIRFAIDMSDLNFAEPSDELRQPVGLARTRHDGISEQWRAAELLALLFSRI